MLVKANIKIIVFSLHMSYSPIKVIDIFNFKLDIIVLYEAGMVNLNNISNLLALNVLNNLIKSLSILLKPL